MKKHVVMALGLAWVAVFCLAGSSEAVKFRYENLGTLGGNQTYTNFDFKEAGINNAGQVAGISLPTPGEPTRLCQVSGSGHGGPGLASTGERRKPGPVH